MTVQVSTQKAFVPVRATGAQVSSQQAFVIIYDTGVQPPEPSATRRRMPCFVN